MTRTVNNARNPVWADYQKTVINLEVDFDELDEEYVSFTANPNDVEPHGVEIYNRALAGEFGPIADWVPPENITGDQAMALLRKARNSRLEKTDYIEMPTKWMTLTAEKQTEWATYRNALRDLPTTYPNPELHWNDDYTQLTWYNITLPEQPS